MTSTHKTPKAPSNEYLERAGELSREEANQLMERMRGRFVRGIENKSLTILEALALQLEIEDEHLLAWRSKFAEIRNARQA